MSRRTIISCDCCGKEVTESQSITIKGKLSVIKRYPLDAANPKGSSGCKEELLFGEENIYSGGRSESNIDCCYSCWERIQKRIGQLFKMSAKKEVQK